MNKKSKTSVTSPCILSHIINMSDSRKNPKGFTLTELLVAMTISSVVLTLAASGLGSIMEANAKADDQTTRRIEINRALDFISDEVRQAQSIATNASASGITYTVASGVTSAQPILALTVPGVPNPIVYYVANPQSNSIWSGPRVIYRWGPTLNANGTYSNPTVFYNEVLVDSIANDTPSSGTCPSATSPNPSAINARKGFYSCVNVPFVGSPQGKLTHIFLRGKTNTSSADYTVSTTVSSRLN